MHVITCTHCDSEMEIDDETMRLGGYIECPICGKDTDIPE